MNSCNIFFLRPFATSSRVWLSALSRRSILLIVRIKTAGFFPVGHANFRIARSEFCTKIWICRRTLLQAQIGPVLHALPYVVELFTDPPDELDEVRIPTRGYVTTIALWFKNWGIHIDAFRK